MVNDLNLTDLIIETVNPTPAAGDPDDDQQTDDSTLTDDDEPNLMGEEPQGEAEADDEPPEGQDPTDADDSETFILTIEGQEQEVSLDQLVRSYQVGNAADVRLQEATEARKTAVEEGKREGMQQAQQELQAQRAELQQSRSQLGELLQHVGPALFAPQVERPDVSMRETDPVGYHNKMDDFWKDQQRIQGLQNQVVQLTENQRQAMEAEQQQIKATNRQELFAKRPDLAKPEAVATFTSNVRKAADFVGFTAEEVDAFPDHRGLLLLDAFGQLLAEKEAGGPTPAQRVVRKAKKPMAPGEVTYRRSKAKQARDANVKRAKATGSVKDVAATLLVDG